MKRALELAKKAFDEGEVPVGALIIYKDQIISEAHNQTEFLLDPSAHAELLAIRRACQVLGNWRLSDCTLYTTLEPCAMCAGAIIQARLKKVVWGAPDIRCGGGELLDGRYEIHQVHSCCLSLGKEGRDSRPGCKADDDPDSEESGEEDNAAGGDGSRVKNFPKSNCMSVEIEKSVMADEAAQLMKDFFKERRHARGDDRAAEREVAQAGA